MAEPDRRRRSRSGRLLDAVVWGAALGAASGAALANAIEGIPAGLGALIGAALYSPAEAFTTLRRGAAQVKPLWYRILSSALLMAVFGWLLGLIYDEPLFIALVSGGLLGLLGLRPGKAFLGLLVGAVLGALFQAARRQRRTGAGRGRGHADVSRNRGDRISRAGTRSRHGRGGAGLGAALCRAI